jgi:3-deoxy-manno-octulosonate cytidylyltransferase (CMP-KDO synthetase)
VAEKLEQLRVLGMGWPIQVGQVAAAHRGVDTPEDYDRFVRNYRDKPIHVRAA